MEAVAGSINEFVPVFFQVNPLEWNMNISVGMLGMVLFFNLSGFLITSYLLRSDAKLPEFLIRRLCRVLPLAWLYLAVVLMFSDASARTWLANYLFYANLPPKQLVPLAEHFWSLCVEIQFYAGVALLFLFLRAKGLLLLPLICIGFTLLRVANGSYASSVTYFRIDEILAGCILALIVQGKLGAPGRWLLREIAAMPKWPMVLLLVISCFRQSGWLNYLRPYLSVLLIASTMLTPETILGVWLRARWLSYVATISYALYVLHLGLTGTWLGSGELLEKYIKRPLLVVALFGLAHLSTFHYERRWIAFGKRLSESIRRAGQRSDPAASI